MEFKIIRNDISKIDTEAIVCISESDGAGCEGKTHLTADPDFPSKKIIHTVRLNNSDADTDLRPGIIYQNSLKIAYDNGLRSVAFPISDTINAGLSKEEELRIAIDEIHLFQDIYENDMIIYLVIFSENKRRINEILCPDLQEYIDCKYIGLDRSDESVNGPVVPGSEQKKKTGSGISRLLSGLGSKKSNLCSASCLPGKELQSPQADCMPMAEPSFAKRSFDEDECEDIIFAEKRYEDNIFDGRELDERMKHMSDSFSEYLQYLIKSRGMENAEVYKRGIVDRKTFSKIKNNVDYHPNKMTALCLCIGAKLNLDESRDLLARAGYALSPCDKTDIIFSYFIENEIYDMIELDIQLEDHGLPCIIA